jgi:hypothetical protein
MTETDKTNLRNAAAKARALIAKRAAPVTEATDGPVVELTTVDEAMNFLKGDAS